MRRWANRSIRRAELAGEFSSPAASACDSLFTLVSCSLAWVICLGISTRRFARPFSSLSTAASAVRHCSSSTSRLAIACSICGTLASLATIGAGCSGEAKLGFRLLQFERGLRGVFLKLCSLFSPPLRRPHFAQRLFIEVFDFRTVRIAQIVRFGYLFEAGVQQRRKLFSRQRFRRRGLAQGRRRKPN